MKLSSVIAVLLALIVAPSFSWASDLLMTGTLSGEIIDHDLDEVLSAGDEIVYTTLIQVAEETPMRDQSVDYELDPWLVLSSNSVIASGEAAVSSGNDSADTLVSIYYGASASSGNTITFSAILAAQLPSDVTAVTMSGSFQFAHQGDEQWLYSTTNILTYYIGQSLALEEEPPLEEPVTAATLMIELVDNVQAATYTYYSNPIPFAQMVTIYNAGPRDVKNLIVNFAPVDFTAPVGVPVDPCKEFGEEAHFCVAYVPLVCRLAFVDPEPSKTCRKEVELAAFSYPGTITAGTWVSIGWNTEIDPNAFDRENFTNVALYAATATATIVMEDAASEVSVTTQANLKAEYVFTLIDDREDENSAISPLAAAFPLLFAAYYLYRTRRRTQ